MAGHAVAFLGDPRSSNLCHSDPMRPEKKTVNIVSNDPGGTNRLSSFFLSQGLSVACFGTAAEYIVSQRDDGPTCLILDLILPDADGLEFQCTLAESGAPPVIFVTAHAKPISVVRAMKNGAIDFMVEPVDLGQLMAAVELAFAKDSKKQNEGFERASLLQRWRSLTPRETEVFHYTVAGLLNKQAAAELGVAENTYQVHRGRVMRKMQANSLAELVRMSTKLELILPTPWQRRICYGVTVAMPMRNDGFELPSLSNVSTSSSRETSKAASSRENRLSAL
jgi:FixJ family two-component response regulator